MADGSERDRAIEHLLRHGAAGRRVSPPTETCIDGEMLAAWSSGALDPAVGVRVEEHVADCARCQSILAAFVRTEPVIPAPAPWWQRAQMRWLAPLATAATVAAIWVAIPQRDRSATPPVEVRDRAVVEEPPAVSAKPEPPPGPGGQTAPSAAQSAVPKREAFDARASADSIERREKASATTARQTGRGVAAGNQPAPPQAAAPPAPSLAESVTVTAESPLMARAAGVEIVSPDGTTRWRIAGSQVQRSTTHGASWEPMTLSSEATLTSGHSPAMSVAWLVGKAGAIYVTTDGAHFERVPFVSSADLISVVAIDDRQATVTTVDGRAFRTADRGRTWSPP